MRRMKTVLIIALLLVSALPFVQKAEATLGEAKVYIICLSDVPIIDSWVNNTSRIKDGAIEACMLQGQYIHRNVPRAHPKRNVDYPPYYEATPYVVTSWSQYASIITSYSEVIVVNTHGQYLPVPSGYTKEQWVDKIADAMLNRRLTWVHVGGYTFIRVWYQQTGTGEEWGEDGFKRLMSHINKSDVNCWPPAPISETENLNATMQLNTEQQIGISWQFERVPGITCKLVDIDLATLGRPLKFDDFEEYLIMPLFKYQDYYAGAVIAFVKAGARYTDEHGCGAYVHIGARHLYDGGGNPFDADFGRGFIGTAAALWAESMGFDAKMDAKQWGSPYPYPLENASLVVQPSVSGVRWSGTDLIVTMTFAVYGATQSHEDDGLYFEDAYFKIDEVSGSDWSDVTMRVDLGLSREGYGDGLVLSGLYDEGQAPYGLAASGIMWILGAPKLLAVPPVAASILWGIGGVKLLAGWIGQGSTANFSGVGDFAPYIDFRYLPAQNYTLPDDKIYWEFTTLTTVELLIPTSGKSGWHVLPLEYQISALPSWYWWDNPGWLDVNDTLELAIWLGAGEGCQSDAGSNRDATSSNPVSVAFPESYHGYLGGGDNDDWYTFTMESGEYILIQMNPPPFVDFDLELYRPDDTLKAESNQGAGITDTIGCMTDCGGTWKLRIYKVQGSGVYSLDLNFCFQLSISSAEGGTTDPAPGTYTYDYGESVIVTPIPDPGTSYVFDCWCFDGATVYSNPITVIMDSDHTLTAYFKRPGSCPTLFVWNGIDYVEEGILNIHADSDVTVQHEIENTLALENGVYNLQLRELDNHTSHIDQVKLYAVDDEGERHNCPLTYAYHNELGKVKQTLRFDDDNRVNLKPTETIALKFAPSISYDKTTQFIFEINGYNAKTPW